MTFTVCHGFSMALIEIDGFYLAIKWVDGPWRTVNVITRPGSTCGFPGTHNGGS